MYKKIVRSICYFSANPSGTEFQKLDQLESLFKSNGFEVQTKRLVSPNLDKIIDLDQIYAKKGYSLAVGSLSEQTIANNFDRLTGSNNISYNVELSGEVIDITSVGYLLEIIKNKPSMTFNFTYVFNNPFSTPFFPAAQFENDGFSIGLQSTDLAADTVNLKGWFKNMKTVWEEIGILLKDNRDFLGIDSSVAPYAGGVGSFVNLVKRTNGSFTNSLTTDTYTQITNFIKEENPTPVGLCGLMFPTLEDFELTEEYEKGNFTIERNIYLSLHSGVGIDTYPLGVDESPQKILEILKLVQSLSNKYKKPLAVRFASDGNAKIGEKTDFRNQYLKDVIVRAL